MGKKEGIETASIAMATGAGAWWLWWCSFVVVGEGFSCMACGGGEGGWGK
jgi:hypothetical protein